MFKKTILIAWLIFLVCGTSELSQTKVEGLEEGQEQYEWVVTLQQAVEAHEEKDFSQEIEKEVKLASSEESVKRIYFTKDRQLRPDETDQAEWIYEVSSDELYLLQKIVMAEAEGEPFDGKVAVANVVLNRLRSKQFPDTITDVICQKSQFSPVKDGRLDRVEPDKDSILAVETAIRGIKLVPDETMYFMNLKIATDFTVSKSKTKVAEIGQHTFFM